MEKHAQEKREQWEVGDVNRWCVASVSKRE